MPFLFFSIAKGKLPTYILPCFAPLSILMARYALEAAKTGAKALRINGMINSGVGLLGLIAVLVVSPWGFMHKPVWTKIELYKCLLAAIAFAVWALMGWLAMKDSGRRWSLAALCPLGLGAAGGLRHPGPGYRQQTAAVPCGDRQRIPAAQPLRPDQQRWDRRRPGTGAEAKRYYYVRQTG